MLATRRIGDAIIVLVENWDFDGESRRRCSVASQQIPERRALGHV